MLRQQRTGVGPKGGREDVPIVPILISVRLNTEDSSRLWVGTGHGRGGHVAEVLPMGLSFLVATTAVTPPAAAAAAVPAAWPSTPERMTFCSPLLPLCPAPMCRVLRARLVPFGCVCAPSRKFSVLCASPLVPPPLSASPPSPSASGLAVCLKGRQNTQAARVEVEEVQDVGHKPAPAGTAAPTVVLEVVVAAHRPRRYR